LIAEAIDGKNDEHKSEENFSFPDLSVSYAEISRLTQDKFHPPISRSHVRNVLCGICKPSEEIALRIGAALGMYSVQDLFDFIRLHIEYKAKNESKKAGKRKNKVDGSKVQAIRGEPEDITTRELAEKYGVSRTSVSNIRRKDHLGNYVVYKITA